MTQQIYLEDSYIKEFDATVLKIEGNNVYLDKTAFYAQGGGQPYDTGTLIHEGTEYNVLSVKKTEEGIAHEVDKEGLKEGDTVKGKINWERRYKLMRMHTAAHALSTVFHEKTGALITGNQLGEEKTHFDFSLENFDREIMEQCVNETNSKIKQDNPVKSYELDREEAMKIPGIVKLATALPPSIPRLRIVEIGEIDKQADGGTHVKNTQEIGQIQLMNLENKGKGRKRLYFTLTP